MANQDLQHMPTSPWPTAAKPGGSLSRTEGTASFAERTERAAERAAGSAIEQVDSVRTGIAQQRGQVAARIRRVSDLMRDSGDRVRKEDELAAHYFQVAGQRIDGVAEYVGSADLSTMAADAHELIRKHPAVFFGGAFLVGLAAGRFLKASSGSNYLGRGGSGSDPRSTMSYGSHSSSSASSAEEQKRLTGKGSLNSQSGANPTSPSPAKVTASPSNFGASPAQGTPTYPPAVGPAPRPATQTNPDSGNGHKGNPGSRLP